MRFLRALLVAALSAGACALATSGCDDVSIEVISSTDSSVANVDSGAAHPALDTLSLDGGPMPRTDLSNLPDGAADDAAFDAAADGGSTITDSLVVD